MKKSTGDSVSIIIMFSLLGIFFLTCSNFFAEREIFEHYCFTMLIITIGAFFVIIGEQQFSNNQNDIKKH